MGHGALHVEADFLKSSSDQQGHCFGQRWTVLMDKGRIVDSVGTAAVQGTDHDSREQWRGEKGQ
jgi:hypothetical protein